VGSFLHMFVLRVSVFVSVCHAFNICNRVFSRVFFLRVCDTTRVDFRMWKFFV